MRSSWAYKRVTDDVVFLEDNDDGHMSVTNDAEAVVAEVNKKFPNRRIIYRDTAGNWDELLHKDGTFTGFTPSEFKEPA